MGRLRRDKSPHESGERFEVQAMWNITQEIMRLHILGIKNVKIANKLNITAVTVSNALNSSLVRKQVAIMQAARDVDTVNISRRILELAPKAIDVMEEVMASESETGAVRLRAATELLNRNSETAPVRRLEASGGFDHYLRGKHIEEVKKLAKERGLIGTSSKEPIEEASFETIDSDEEAKTGT